MTDTKIVGIVLVRNEDLYLGRVLANIKDFCDRIIIADHCSNDDTDHIAKDFCDKTAGARYHRIGHPGLSHELIKAYAGEKVWVFGVDGDELYEAGRLAGFRKQLLSGRHDNCWMLLGNVLNCIEIDPRGKLARGYTAPPCRSMTKLYNFNAIASWEGACSERLHGGQIVFKPGYGRQMRCDISKTSSWEDAAFRCLHLCFLPRSSLEKNRDNRLTIRKNIADRISENLLARIKSSVNRCLGHHEVSPLKREKYMRGQLVTVDIRSFLL